MKKTFNKSDDMLKFLVENGIEQEEGKEKKKQKIEIEKIECRYDYATGENVNMVTYKEIS